MPGRLSIAGSREKLVLIASLLLGYREPDTYVSTGKIRQADTEKRIIGTQRTTDCVVAGKNADHLCHLCPYHFVYILSGGNEDPWNGGKRGA